MNTISNLLEDFDFNPITTPLAFLYENLSLQAMIILIALPIIWILIMTAKAVKTNRLHYTKIEALFTKAEINFLRTLEKVVTNPNVAIFGKVRIADIITPQKTANKEKWWRLFNKISSKHVDYVLCDKKDYSVICVIELNDSSHNTAKAKERDAFVRKAYQSAGIELVEIKAHRYYDVDQIAMQFSEEVKSVITQ